jgi:2-oxoglutarate dehydrogenase E2 component (dihydrolipoamide succinyltransferase)
MDRMRKLISGYMVAFQTSAHVQSFIEVDVTNIVKWREKIKCFRKERRKLTSIFMEAVAKSERFSRNEYFL